MARHRIILDCDPGVDDAVALFLALGSPEEIEILGVTTVVGNGALEQTQHNARRVLSFAGRRDIPVFAGCPRPLLKSQSRHATVHGGDGLGDIGLPEPSFDLVRRHAVDFIVEQVMGAPGEITLCPIGPMTNLALAIVKEPRVAERVKEIVFMGGAAFCPGNMSPVAEFNIFLDPHAAQIVLTSAARCTMLGLDVTRQAQITPDRLETLAASGGVVSEAAARMLAAYGGGDPCLHDPCVIARLLDPSLFQGFAAEVTVSCDATPECGQTVTLCCEDKESGRAPNCHVVIGVEAERLFSLLTERLARL